MSVRRQTLAPGAATPPHSHDCDEVVLCLAGQGEVHGDGRFQRFGSDSTMVLPRRRVHQLFNVGATPLEIVGIFAATPVTTRLPDGAPIDLAWCTSAHDAATGPRGGSRGIIGWTSARRDA
jgi:quercetin dioxygenase-like cupin family protein